MRRTRDLSQYRDILPYASEIFGVYQPMLGWRSRRIRARIEKGFRGDLARVFRSLYGRFKGRFEFSLDDRRSLEAIRRLEPAELRAADQLLGGSFVLESVARRLPPLEDYNDSIFFDDTAVPVLTDLRKSGHEMGSHTVAHSRRFEDMAMGTGRERYPRYRPLVTSETTVKGATILGELRVSKFLLEALTGARVESFRPGRLSYPFSLPQALNATGYRYSSSITANTVLTHLPFQLTDGRADGALQPIYDSQVQSQPSAQTWRASGT